MTENVEPSTNVLFGILSELKKANRLKEEELRQQWFFIELVEACLPIPDGKKKQLHERCMKYTTRL